MAVRSVLWVTSEPPDRALAGGSIRQAHLLTALSTVADVDLVTVGAVRDEAVLSAVRRARSVGPRAEDDGITAGRRHRIVRSVRQVVVPVAPHVWDERRHRRLFEQEITLSDHDVVLVEHVGLWPLVRHRRPGQRWILTVHNVASVSLAAQGDLAGSRRSATLLHAAARWSARAERDVLVHYDAVISVSDDDALLLGPTAVVVPNGVDTTRFAPTPLPKRPSVVFTGHLAFAPNVDGAQWLADTVWPRVREAVPEATLVVAGRLPAADVSALARRPNVSVEADPPDIGPFLEDARVVVVPLRFGTGTRLKALEAMAAGRPVVGTSVGLAGLGVVADVDAIVADDAGRFAAAVVRLLTDELEAASVASAGRRLAERFSWERIAPGFCDVVVGANRRRSVGET